MWDGIPGAAPIPPWLLPKPPPSGSSYSWLRRPPTFFSLCPLLTPRGCADPPTFFSLCPLLTRASQSPSDSVTPSIKHVLTSDTRVPAGRLSWTLLSGLYTCLSPLQKGEASKTYVRSCLCAAYCPLRTYAPTHYKTLTLRGPTPRACLFVQPLLFLRLPTQPPCWASHHSNRQACPQLRASAHSWTPTCPPPTYSTLCPDVPSSEPLCLCTRPYMPISLGYIFHQKTHH